MFVCAPSDSFANNTMCFGRQRWRCAIVSQPMRRIAGLCVALLALTIALMAPRVGTAAVNALASRAHAHGPPSVDSLDALAEHFGFDLM